MSLPTPASSRATLQAGSNGARDTSASITCTPNFAYGIAETLLTRDSPYDLESLRLAINGSEQIDVEMFERFIDHGQRRGLNPASAFAVYGLAEATLAVTFPRLGSGLESEKIDEAALQEGRALRTTRSLGRRVALLGGPVRNMEVAIQDEEGVQPPEGVLGEIVIRGDSVVSQPKVERFTNHSKEQTEWFNTGDLGYLRDGQLAVCGRKKDLIIVAGRNIFPSEVERRIASVAGVYGGHCAVFSVRGRATESVVAVVETKIERQDRPPLAAEYGTSSGMAGMFD